MEESSDLKVLTYIDIVAVAVVVVVVEAVLVAVVVAVGVAIEQVPLTHSRKGRAVTHLLGAICRAVCDMSVWIPWRRI